MTIKEYRQNKKPELGIYKAGDVWHKEWEGYPDYIKGGYYVSSGKRMTIGDEQDCDELIREYAKLKCQELLEIVAEKVNIQHTFTNNIYEKTAHDYDKIFIVGNSMFSIDKDSILNTIDLNKFI